MCCSLIPFDFWANILPPFFVKQIFCASVRSIAALSVAHIQFTFLLVNFYLDIFEHVIDEFPETLFSLVFV